MKLQRWPILFKKSSTGKVLIWEIWVRGNTICTSSGQEDGKMRETADVIKIGKNIGRANETTPHEQAVAEAQSKWNKQIDRGYVLSREDALAGKVDDKVEGGFFPMLAESFDDCEKHISYPCYVQPKLDGLRAVWTGKFYSRSRKPFQTMRHIESELKRLGIDHLQLDGELYTHDLKDQFEEIVSAIKRGKTEHPIVHKIQYHVFDINLQGTSYSLRLELLRQLKKQIETSSSIKLVETKLVSDREALMKAYEDFMEQGYEGAMIRNMHGPYEEKRSKHLQKLKVFQDDEFRIVGIEEGRGALAGAVGRFICEIEDPLGDEPPRQFGVKMRGTGVTKFLKEAFQDEKLWKGKWLQVQFQGYTRKNRVPRFPVGIKFREAE